jgi:AraC family transcriptional activator of tynA and feaB
MLSAGEAVTEIGKMPRGYQPVDQFRSVVKEVYYELDSYPICKLERTPVFNLETAVASALPVTRFHGTDIDVRRQWQHIRSSKSGIYVIHFPLIGSLSVTQDASQDARVGANDFTITYGDRPFHVRAVAENGPLCSQLHIIVPAHIMHEQFPDVDLICGYPFPASNGPAHIARQLFLASLGASDVSYDAMTKIGLAGLEAIVGSIKHRAKEYIESHDAKRANFVKITRFLDNNLSVQGLKAEKVADACNMSRRYLHYIMQHNNTTFSEYLWELRLQKAHEWLTDPEFCHFNIVDIAYMAGFSSSSHFSNTYRRRFAKSPSDARGSTASDLIATEPS